MAEMSTVLLRPDDRLELKKKNAVLHFNVRIVPVTVMAIDGCILSIL